MEQSGRHTSVTDLPLTPVGEAVALQVGERLAGEEFDLVLTSPRLRARRTADLLGHDDAEVDEDLVEWGYGDYEGITNAADPQDRPGLDPVDAPGARRRDRRAGHRAAGPRGRAGAAPPTARCW